MTRRTRSRPARRALPALLRRRVGRLVRRRNAAATRRLHRLERRVETLETELRRRLDDVEEGLQEQRALSQRVAALGDLVAEVVAAAAHGDRADLEAALARYRDGL